MVPGACSRMPSWVPASAARARSRSRNARPRRSTSSAEQLLERRAPARGRTAVRRGRAALSLFGMGQARDAHVGLRLPRGRAVCREPAPPPSATSTSIPADVDAPYAQFLLALSYYDQIDDIGRDQATDLRGAPGAARRHRALSRQRVRQSAQMKFELAFDHLAGKEMEIGRYYLSPGLLHRRDQPLPRRRRGLPDHHPDARGALPPGRGLPRRSASTHEAQTAGGDPRLQLPGHDLVCRRLRAPDRPRPASRRTSATAG